MADKDLAAALGYASDGGIVDALFGDVTIPARINQNIARQGARTRARIQAQRQAQGPAFYDQAIPMEGRATFLPFRISPTGQKSFAMPGLFAGAINAITAPGRALRGTDPTFNPEQEAFDVALNTMGMGGAVGRAPAGSLPMNVYHGSPHLFAPTKRNPLGEFDSTKMGTGEGAQAYGVGSYFAEAPGVASRYKDSTSANMYETSNGVIRSSDLVEEIFKKSGNVPTQLESAYRAKANEVVRDLIMGKSALEIANEIRSSRYGRTYDSLANAVENLSPKAAQGNLYKVDLPDEAIALMLDWDKPLNEQPARVTQPIYNSMIEAGFDKGIVNYILNNKTGRDLYNDLAGRLPIKQPGPQSGQDMASNFLRTSGLKGIRYLDEGSRAQGAGTSNFVVFPGNEDILTILERNGVPAQPTSVEYIDPFRDTTR